MTVEEDMKQTVRILGDVLTQNADELVELRTELELVQGELQDERTARLLSDNRICELEDAIRAHRKAIRERVPVKSGRDIDAALWKQVDQ